jgi:predicted signal transduction protein with EAL and GGDEF domain
MPLGNGDQLGVSVSIGVASVSASEPTEIESLLTRADEALYVAKARGRNRIEIADAYAGGAVMRIGGDVPAAELPAQNSANAALGVVVSPAISPAQEGDLRPSVVVSGRPLAGNFSAALARDGNDRRR